MLVVKIKVTGNLPTTLRKIMVNCLSEEDPFIDKKITQLEKPFYLINYHSITSIYKTSVFIRL